MNAEETIKNKISKYIDLIHFDIRDKTGKHIHHRNFDGGLHLSIILVSDGFLGLPLLNRHQLVYKALGTLIKNEIHALSIKTYTSEEWENQVS
ncbi:MAG: BolA family transcriptional regulator [Candidatus Marinimicrobia bacterium]|nr:BolA family transcriptional regulator [Candidatus Neomarinimicrobiota bacterium]MBL7011131.1 BolA family transcriptional regulator [Candidatus Neomarinimicrobiota bacterium]MBL7031507.1 BolA family transcriptional regulator [Candidatus Neomarinimicrobiota bacterium]